MNNENLDINSLSQTVNVLEKYSDDISRRVGIMRRVLQDCKDNLENDEYSTLCEYYLEDSLSKFDSMICKIGFIQCKINIKKQQIEESGDAF